MGKRQRPEPPPLSPEQMRELRILERNLSKCLTDCGDLLGREVDSYALQECLRTWTREIFDFLLSVFRNDSDYCSEWMLRCKGEAIHRATTCLRREYTLSEVQIVPFRAKLHATLNEHIARRGRALREHRDAALTSKQSASYARAGVDLTSASPLLMALEAANVPQTVWTPVPKPRIPRSIHSEKAARRMEEYIQRKGLTQSAFSIAVEADERTLRRFRASGKVDKAVAQRIANAMKITLDDLLS